VPAGRYNLTIEEGVDLDLTFTWKDSAGSLINLTGSTAALTIRNLDGTDLLAVTDTPGVNGNVITLGGVAGTIHVFISHLTTDDDDLNFDETDYDLMIFAADGTPKRLLKGDVFYSPRSAD
jgi:hypothetical protein